MSLREFPILSSTQALEVIHAAECMMTEKQSVLGQPVIRLRCTRKKAKHKCQNIVLQKVQWLPVHEPRHMKPTQHFTCELCE